MRMQEILREARDALKRRNIKKIESIFSAHLRTSHSCELWSIYLQHVQNTGVPKETQKEALVFAYKKTLLGIESADIKIRYLEMIMQEEEKEAAQKIYLEMLCIPMVRVDTLIELHRSYNIEKEKDMKRDSTFSKEEEALVVSKALVPVLSCGSEALAEYALSQMHKHPLYTPEIVMHALDTAIEELPESASLAVYKVFLLEREKERIGAGRMVNLHTKKILNAKGRTEYMAQMKNYLEEALNGTEGSLAVLSALTAYQIDPEVLEKTAPFSITKKSESFYLIFFSALLRHRDISGVRKYLVKLAKEEKIGHLVYIFCAMVEGIIKKENRNAGGIILSALKRFLHKRREKKAGEIPNAENAYWVALNGTKILIALGDVQKASMITDLYNKETEEKDKKKSYTSIEKEEIHPRMAFTRYQVLFESGFIAALSLLSEFTYPEVYRFICRCYAIEESTEEETKSIAVIEKFAAQLMPIRETHNICSNVDLNAVIRLLVETTIG